MARLNLNRATLPEFEKRVRALLPDSRRLWGKMDAARMVRHLIYTFENSLGIEKVDRRVNPVVRALIFFVFFQLITTWPKGKIKGPDFVTPPPKGDFASEQNELLRLMEQFVGAFEQNPARVEVNPGMGGISLAKWSRVHGVHSDHHLRQFGV